MDGSSPEGTVDWVAFDDIWLDTGDVFSPLTLVFFDGVFVAAWTFETAMSFGTAVTFLILVSEDEAFTFFRCFALAPTELVATFEGVVEASTDLSANGAWKKADCFCPWSS